jgi:thiamine kinase-like enzyme
MPEILRDFEWTDPGVRWHALQLSLAPSPAILGQSWIAEPLHSIDDRWIGELKQAIGAINKAPLTRWAVHPGRIARVIAQRFGKRAPYSIDDWQTAHGDLNWGNVTAPQLMLLDWEFWGAAPRGFDAATLLAHSFLDPALFRRIEAAFADDLNTRSGIAARLYQFASLLNKIEADLRDPREHRIAEAEARRLLCL